MIFLNFVNHHFKLLIFLIVFAFLATCALTIWEAWIGTRKRPREDMYWCGKKGHGMFRKKHCLELFPGMKKQNGEPFLMCPICYKEQVFDALPKVH